MKIAVTAANGQLGGEIIKACIKLVGKENIIGLARTPSKAEHLPVEIRPGDYNRQQELRQSLNAVDTILLVSSNDQPDNRIHQHRNVINAAQSAGATKIVFTSIQGPEMSGSFAPIVQSSRQTEADIRHSDMDWVIGRNGIYIEPDLESIDEYKKAGAVHNCAGTGKCGYTTRPELATAYSHMLTEKQHNGQTFNLHGQTITQQQLVDYMNDKFRTHLVYHSISEQQFREDRINALGPFLGGIIAGIYSGIRDGYFDNPSQFDKAAGRMHQQWRDYFQPD